MEKRAEWATLTSAAHFPISGRHPAIENGIKSSCAECVAKVGELLKGRVGKTLSAVTTTGTLSPESTFVAGPETALCASVGISFISLASLSLSLSLPLFSIPFHISQRGQF